ncbi:nucleotide exchange factor GrpE [Anaeromassilibacillus senegalensis]|uniref:nucleotide exchange factor GrpE n=1 Tax=Anaeromassilibacillus senegalensis TaxID=1673717 RepID=UPI00068269EF|nr:nucleotide exchange factor GrpE [Anaeromassilibacillus senegalensis]
MNTEEKNPQTEEETVAEPETEQPEVQAEKAKKDKGGFGGKKAKAEKEEMQKKLDEAEAALKKQKDQLLRTAAEYDNFRKRTEREKASIYTDATAAAVQEFLPVADNLERALAQQECSVEDLRKGVEMVQAQLMKALEKLGVAEMGAVGEAFNPDIHNAVSHIDDESADENVIAQVFQKGYKMGDKVVRHAVVVVAN